MCFFMIITVLTGLQLFSGLMGCVSFLVELTFFAICTQESLFAFLELLKSDFLVMLKINGYTQSRKRLQYAYHRVKPQPRA